MNRIIHSCTLQYPSVVKEDLKPPARRSAMVDRSAVLARRFSSDDTGMRFPSAADHVGQLSSFAMLSITANIDITFYRSTHMQEAWFLHRKAVIFSQTTLKPLRKIKK